MEITRKEELFIPELFEVLPESVIWFTPVRVDDKNDQSTIINFEIRYCNDSCCDFLNMPKEEIIGQLVLGSSIFDSEYQKNLFKQCLHVWENHQPAEENFFNKDLQKYFSVLRSRCMDGIISVTRDRTTFYKAEQEHRTQANLLNQILDTSPACIIAYEGIYDEKGNVIDFKIIRANKRAQESTGKSLDELIQKSFCNNFPDMCTNGILDIYKNVISTGRPYQGELLIDSLGGWFNVSLIKLDSNQLIANFLNINESKEATIRIEEQAKLLDSILDVSINVVFALEARRDNDGKITDQVFVKVNKLFSRITNTTEEEVLGQSLMKLFPSAKNNGLFETNCQVIETGEPLRTEFFYIGDGLNNWFDISMIKLGDNGLVVTFADITQSRKNELQLEQSSHRLQTIINSSNAGIITAVPVYNSSNDIIDFEFTLANKKVTSYIGKEPGTMIGRKASEWFPAYLTNGLFEQFKTVYITGHSLQHDFHYRDTNAGAWIDMMATRMEEELLITFTDFTAIKKLQDELETAARRLQTVIETSQVGIFTLIPIKDDQQNITDFKFSIVNPAVASYIGQTTENLLDEPASKWFPAYHSNRLFEIYKKVFETGNSERFNFHYEDGYDVYFDMMVTKIEDEVLVTFTDYTAIKKLQLQLERSIEELQRSNSSLEEFAYAASHDLQEPLRKINYFSERLKAIYEDALTPESIMMFERMEISTTRMRLLIDDLLAYSQVSTKSRISEAVDLGNVIQQVSLDLETVINDKKGVIISELLPVVKGDAMQLRQLFQNLVSNSLKYSKPDISPVIEIRSSNIMLPFNGHQAPFFKIEIKDNGIGFEQEHAQKIFQVFQRLHGKSEYPGTGVGLAIVQKVIANHGGMITAEGKVDEGSVFTVYLPVMD